jgi:hypothetical protein
MGLAASRAVKGKCRGSSFVCWEQDYVRRSGIPSGIDAPKGSADWYQSWRTPFVAYCSKRFPASSKSSGVMLRYTCVARIWTWPR